jgi:hypothetical protein
MDLITLVATLIFVVLAAGFGALFARLTARDRLSLPLEDWEGIFSPSRYKAMERLLDEADERFLLSHRKFNSDGDQKFRRRRVKIFRGYMQQLSEDFTRICKTLKLMMVESRVDRQDLAGVIMKQQFTFTFLLMMVEMKLTLYSLGWAHVDAKALLQPLAALRSQLQMLAAIADPSLSCSKA